MDNILFPTIREMTDFDIKDVSVLWYKLADDQSLKNKYIEKNKVQQFNICNYFNECLKNKNCKVFVAEYKNVLIGFAEVWICKKDIMFEVEDFAYISHFFVDKGLSKGLNSFTVPAKLYKKCESWGMDHHVNYLCSDVYACNLRVNELIMKKTGAKPYKIRYAKRLIK